MIRTFDDISRIYMVDICNKDYVNHFKYAFDALYDLGMYIRKNIGMKAVRLVPFIPFNNKACLLVTIPSNEFKSPEIEVDELFNVTEYFYTKYDLGITEDIFIDLGS